MHRYLNRMIGLVFITGMTVMFCASSATAEDACQLAKSLRNERLATDATLRRARAAQSQKIITLRAQMNDLDNKIADVEDELLKATSERRKDLLEQYDKLGEQREKHSNEIAPLQKEYSRIATERLTKKLALKKTEMTKRYECALNEPLTTALTDIEKKFPKTKEMLPVDKDEMTNLIKQRENKIKELRSEYQSYTQTIDMKFAEFQRLMNMMDELSKNETTNDSLIDKQHDSIYESFDLLDRSIEKFDSETTKISEELLKYTK